jgi:hypothetical protein
MDNERNMVMIKRILALIALSMAFCMPSWAAYTDTQVTVNDIEGNTVYIGTATSGTPFVQFNSTSTGILLPEMTTTQMNAVSSPQAGELLYNTTGSAFYFYNGSSWTTVAAPVTSGTAILSGNGTGGLHNVTIGSGLNYNTASYTLSLTSGSWVPNNIQVFTTTGTWTKPAGVSTVYVKVVGGGGAGGAFTTRSGGGGGGGGGYAEGPIAVTGNVTVTIGSTNSFAGTTTISATTGSAGNNATASVGGTGGAGGVGSGGSLNTTGTVGGTGSGNSNAGSSEAGGSGGVTVMGSIGRGGDGGSGGNAALAADPGAVIVYY